MILTEEQKIIALDMAALGFTKRDILEKIMVSPLMFSKYLSIDATFKKQFEQCRETGLHLLADDLITVSETMEDIGRAKLKSDNLRWLLSRRLSASYGDKITIDVNKTVDIGKALSEARDRASLPNVTQRAMPIRDAQKLPAPQPLDIIAVSYDNTRDQDSLADKPLTYELSDPNEEEEILG